MVKVTDRFYITANTNCYTLQEKSTIKDVESQNYGKEVFRDIGYYTTIESCLKGILKTITREYVGKEDVNNIRELLQEIKLQNEYIQSLKIDV